MSIEISETDKSDEGLNCHKDPGYKNGALHNKYAINARIEMFPIICVKKIE